MDQNYLFFESIRIENGRFHLLGLHEQRIGSTLKLVFGQNYATNLEKYLSIFDPPSEGLFKCRLRYGMTFDRPEFIAYKPKTISSLQMVVANKLDYGLKREDRREIEALLNKRNNCDDILMIRNGFVTDTSYCNIVFFTGKDWVTPANPLLEGVQRSFLIQSGVIRSEQIHYKEVAHFQCFKLINAMIPWDSAPERNISGIVSFQV